MKSAEHPKKDFGILLLMSAAILSPTLMFTLSGDAPQTLILVVIGLVGSFIFRTPVQQSSRGYIYTFLTAGIVTVFQQQALTISGDRFFLIPAEVYTPALLYLGVSLTYFAPRESIMAAVMALGVVALMLSGNVVGYSGTNESLAQILPALKTLRPETFYILYVIAVGSQALLSLALLRATRCQHRVEGVKKQAIPLRFRLFTKGFFLFCLALVGLIVFTLRVVAFRYEQSMQRLLSDTLTRYVRQNSKPVVFDKSVDLWRTVPFQSSADRTVVLRARAKQAPGYMRGHVYSLYLNGQWTGTEYGRGLTQKDYTGHLAINFFERENRARKTVRVDVLPSEGFRSKVLLAPGAAAAFEIIAGSLKDSTNGVLTPEDWESDSGYVIEMNREVPDPAFPELKLTADSATPYLQIPESQKEWLTPLAAEVFGDRKDEKSVAEKISAVVDYFDNNFAYELGIRFMGDGGDPIRQFLIDKKRGHCELFATGAALLLRSAGVPVRYVTGFVCREPSRTGDYYLSRLADAHAWIEAFDAERGYWVLVEATPASGVPDNVPKDNIAAAAWDRGKLLWQQIWALMKRGYIAQGVFAIFGFIGNILVFAFTNPFAAPPSIFFTISLAWFFFRRHRRRRSQKMDGNHLRRELRELLRYMERHFRKRGIEHPPTATVHQFATQLSESGYGEAAALLYEYESIRFGADSMTQERVLDLSRRVRDQLAKSK